MKTQEVSKLTFDDLLEKYDGKIMLATSEECRRVSPNGLKALFEANRRYRARVSEIPTTHLSFIKNAFAFLKTKTHLRKQVR